MSRAAVTVGLAAALACGSPDPAQDPPDPQTQGFEPPVVTNPDPPVEYPLDLYEEQIEGVVMVHLFIDIEGQVVHDSTRVHESSGYPALDSAALASVPSLTFAPAHLDGRPVATAFLQPFHFRHPDLSGRGETQ